MTKFCCIIDFDVLQKASDIVNQPYGDLISVYAESQTRRIQQLLEGKQLGDENPSQLLCQMKLLVGDTIATKVLKTSWLCSVPSLTEAILISTGHCEIDNEVAYRIHEVQHPKDPNISSQ